MRNHVSSTASVRRTSAAKRKEASVKQLEKPTHFFQKQLQGEEPLGLATAERLFSLGAAINSISPWRFLADQDLFLLRDPKSQEMCYCSVMGAMGQVFSLHVYVGDESYRFFRRLSSGAAVTPEEFLASQKGVSVEFVRLSELTPPDRELLKCLGHPLQRGCVAPIFRALRPGFHPWYVTEGEGSLLAECMLALIAFCQAFSSGKGTSFWSEEDVYPLLAPVAREGSKSAYAIQKLRVPEPLPPAPEHAVVDEDRVRKILGKDPTLRGCLEADFFLALGKIGEKNQRKSCICMGMVADADSGFLFRPELAVASQPGSKVLASALLNAIDDSKCLPAEVHVRKEEFKIMLDSLTRQLGVPIKVVKSLPSLDRAKRGVLGMMAAS